MIIAFTIKEAQFKQTKWTCCDIYVESLRSSRQPQKICHIIYYSETLSCPLNPPPPLFIFSLLHFLIF